MNKSAGTTVVFIISKIKQTQYPDMRNISPI